MRRPIAWGRLRGLGGNAPGAQSASAMRSANKAVKDLSCVRCLVALGLLAGAAVIILGTMMTPAPAQDRSAYRFHTEVRVRLSETDAVGIVFFGSYSTYMDVGRMDYLQNLGLTSWGGPVKDLIPGAVVSSGVRFSAPARYNDVLEIGVRVANLGTSSYRFEFLITNKRSAARVATGQLTLVWLDESFKPVPLPIEFREAVTRFEGRAPSQQ